MSKHISQCFAGLLIWFHIGSQYLLLQLSSKIFINFWLIQFEICLFSDINECLMVQLGSVFGDWMPFPRGWYSHGDLPGGRDLLFLGRWLPILWHRGYCRWHDLDSCKLSFIGSQDIWDYLLFSCEIAHSRKSLISILQEFSSSIDKAFILAGGVGTGVSFYEAFTVSWYFLIC